MMRNDAADNGFDPELLEELRDLAAGEDPGFLSELLASYLKEGRQRVQQLREAVRQGDRRTLLTVSHALKGSSANVGASRLAKLSGGLETELRKSLADGAGVDGSERWPASVEQIAAEFERASGMLGELLGVDSPGD